MLSKIVEEAAFGGILKNEDVVRVRFLKLLIGFITRKVNLLAVSKTFHNVFVVQALEEFKLVFKVFLFFEV